MDAPKPKGLQQPKRRWFLGRGPEPEPIDAGLDARRPRRTGWRAIPPAGPSGRWRLLSARAERAWTWAGDQLHRDLDRGCGFPWVVVAFGLGCLVYFVLPREPWMPALAGLAGLLTAATVAARRSGRDAAVLVVAAAAACGLLAAKIEADRVAAPRLDRERTVSVTGWVEEAEDTADGGTRLILRVAGMESRGRAIDRPPGRIAVTVGRGRDAAVRIGAGLKFLARLRPPDGPVLPGGYDFARRAYFEGRGASGFVLGRVASAELGDPPRWVAVPAAVADLRHGIADRIRDALPGAAGAIAAALIVGEARAIPPDVNEALRTSGLTHIISISGLHMTLVGGGVFVAVRFLLALVPGLVLRVSAKKLAALAAFGAISAYLLISGGGVATNRAYVMFAVGLLAILADRPAVSLRTVALSALVILLVQPHSVTEPGFLMSFLAVIALVSAYEAWRQRPVAPEAAAERASGRIGRWTVAAGRYAAGLASTSLVAGLATAPVIADAFHRTAPYGLVANMVVMPAIGLVVMPMAVVTMLLMPFGLEALPLAAMGAGIEVMIAVARTVQSWPGGEGLIGRLHPWTLPLAVAGMLWLALWQARWRLLGLAPIAAAILIAPFAGAPDVLVGPDGAPVAVRGVDGRLEVLDGARSRFTVATWLAADADTRGPAAVARGRPPDKVSRTQPEQARAGPAERPRGVEPPTAATGRAGAGQDRSETRSAARPTAAAPDAGAPLDAVARDAGAPLDAVAAEPQGCLCDDLGCAIRTRSPTGRPRIVAVVRDPRAFDEDCRSADLVVTRLDAPPGCARLTTVLDRKVLQRLGATAVLWPDRAASALRAEADFVAPTGSAVPGTGPPPYPRAERGRPPTIIGALALGRRPWTPGFDTAAPATSGSTERRGPASAPAPTRSPPDGARRGEPPAAGSVTGARAAELGPPASPTSAAHPADGPELEGPEATSDD